MPEQTTVGQRLSQFIGDEPDKKMSIRAFAAAMKAREPRPKGSTRAMIHRYLAGAPEPPADFITAAADVLNLNPEWLAFGRGPASAGHARVDEWKRKEAVEEHARFLGALGAPKDFHPRHWLPSLLEVQRRLDSGPLFVGGRLREDDSEERIAKALRAPLDAFGVDARRMTGDMLNDYITSMVPVLLALAAERTRQTPHTPDQEED